MMTDPVTAMRAHIAANPVTGAPDEMRAAFAALAGPQPALRMEKLGAVPCAIAGDGTPGALWLHGGGYVFGGVESHGRALRHLADRMGRGAVAMPLYPLAPEAVWPAQRDAALAVLDAFDDPVPIIGDSAGGHLALHVAFARPGRVAALALIGANADRTGLSRTRAPNSARDAMNDDAQDSALAALALPDVAPDSVDASPLTGPLHRLPRLFLTCTENEVLADDTLLLARAAALARVEVNLRVERDLFHMWTLWPHRLPQAARTLDRIADWLAPV